MGLLNRLFHPFSHNDVIAQQALQRERLSDNIDEYRQLMQLQDNRQLVEVYIPELKRSFQSMIIGIDFVEPSLSLDEFSPGLTNPTSLVEQSITIRHQKHWEKLEMHSTIADWSAENHCYRVELPEFVGYQPRRLYPRMILAKNNMLKAQINPLYGAPWYAIVKDISKGGMRITVSGNLRDHLNKDTIFPKCQVVLDDDVTIFCRGIVRSYSYISKPYRHTEISIEFQNMSSSNRTDLTRFIDYINVAA